MNTQKLEEKILAQSRRISELENQIVNMGIRLSKYVEGLEERVVNLERDQQQPFRPSQDSEGIK